MNVAPSWSVLLRLTARPAVWLLIDREEDRTLRAVLVGMLQERRADSSV